MAQHGRRHDGWVTATVQVVLMGGIFLMLAEATPCIAAEQEIRDFTIKVKGEAAGTYRMTITHQDDGSWQMDGKADVQFHHWLKKYTYSYVGTEIWKDGRLIHLDSNTNDDGTKYTVQVRSANNALRVSVNGKDRFTRPDVWTTTYWRLVNGKFHNQAVPLLDADTGKDINATLQFIGVQQINVAGQVQSCTHYSLTGKGVQVQLWYDAQQRMVRQESIESGLTTVLELTRISR
jgi:hypothetical protein